MSARVRQWLGFVIMLVGLGLLCGPFIVGSFHESEQKSVVKQFYRTELSPRGSIKTEIAMGDIKPEATPMPHQDLYDAAAEYNAGLLGHGQDDMKALKDLEFFALDARNYGFSENIVGTIWIPRLEVELGLYLGASRDNMAKGAAIFGYSSVPLGTGDENTAIAGHRGWSGTPMFRDIQQIQMNDPIYITTPWAELEYRVCDIEIVTPDNVEWCRVHPGRTLITLMTCHPYGNNYQRYIVYAELAGDEIPDAEEIMRINAETYDPSAKFVTLVNADGSREVTMVDSSSIEPDGSEYGSVMSNFVIMAEDKMRIVAYVMAVIVPLTGVGLAIATVRDYRKQRGDKTDDTE